MLLPRSLTFVFPLFWVFPLITYSQIRDSVLNDPRLPDQWYYYSIGVDSAHKILRSSLRATSPVIVGVIDTGIDYTHPDLQGQIWANSGEMGVDALGRDKRTNGIDDDGNGYIDDWRGWDFVDNDNDPMDTDGHGTHCAGIIGAARNNGIGIAGIASNVLLVPLRVLRSISEPGKATTASAALDYAIRMGINITNNSWVGESASPLLRDAFQRAGQAGILAITASGNKGQNNDVLPAYPSGFALPTQISVAASDRTNTLASFSNFGLVSVDVAAPGSAILSTEPGGRYGFRDGTSQATPIVTALAALARLQDSTRTPTQLKEILLRSTDRMPTLRGRIRTGGIVNAWKVLSKPDTIAPARIRNVQVDSLAQAFIRCSWLATGDDSLRGTARRYEIRIAQTPITEETFTQSQLISSDTLLPLPALSPMRISIRGLSSATTYFIAIVAKDAWGNRSLLSVTSATTLPRTTTPIVINKFFNSGTSDAAGDAVELLTVERADMRGMIVKDFSSNGGADGGGYYQFRDIPFWASVAPGTLIVLRKDTIANDTDAADGVLTIGLDNPTYFFFPARNSFNIATEEIVMLKEAGALPQGVAGSLHAMASSGAAGEPNMGQPSNAAGYNAIANPKIRASRGNAGAGQTVYAVNPTASLDDFNGNNALGSATAIQFGTANTITNQNFINRLRLENSPVRPVNPVSIGFVRRNVLVPLPNEEVQIQAIVLGNPPRVRLAYFINATSATQATVVEMVRIDSITYQATIPAVRTHGDRVEYTIIADSSGVEIRSPNKGLYGYFIGFTPIATIKALNPDGTLRFRGYSARIRGLVTVSNGVLSNVHLLTYLQDSSAGISIFRAGAVRTRIQQRFEYTVTGEIDQFNGLTQLIPAPGNENLVGGGILPMPDAIVTTPDQLTSSFHEAERLEGRIIRLLHVRYEGMWANTDAVINITVVDTTGKRMVLRGNQQTLGGDPGLSTFFSVAGILSQFDTALPFTEGYQVLGIGEVRQPFFSMISDTLRQTVVRADTFTHRRTIANRGNAPLAITAELQSDVNTLTQNSILPLLLQDPVQPNSAEPDVIAVRGGFMGQALTMKIDFASDLRSSDFTGTIALDMDNNPTTGVFPPPNGSAEQTVGAEILLSFAQIAAGNVLVLDAATRAVIASVPCSFTARHIAFEVPFSLLTKNNHPYSSLSLLTNGISFAATFGTRSRPTDRVPNIGRGFVHEQLVSLTLQNSVVPEGQETLVSVRINAQTMGIGDYRGRVTLTTNDPLQAERSFPLWINVVPRLEADGLVQPSVNLFAYPNPFREFVRIEYRVPKESFVLLEIIDVLGNRLSVLAEGSKKAGVYEVSYTPPMILLQPLFCRYRTSTTTENLQLLQIK